MTAQTIFAQLGVRSRAFPSHRATGRQPPWNSDGFWVPLPVKRYWITSCHIPASTIASSKLGGLSIVLFFRCRISFSMALRGLLSRSRRPSLCGCSSLEQPCRDHRFLFSPPLTHFPRTSISHTLKAYAGAMCLCLCLCV